MKHKPRTIEDQAKRKGYTWISGEYCTAGYVMRFRGNDVKTFTAAGATRSQAIAAARRHLTVM
jgi:hypothetical protein